LSLYLTGLQETKLVLRMADQSRVKPLGILPKIKTSILGIVYLIDFIVFQPSTNNTSYPILLDGPWLYQAQAKDDRGRGTLTIGRGPSKIKLNMYPSHYQGEIQWQSPEVTSDQGYTTDGEDLVPNRVFIKPKGLVQPFKRKIIYKEVGLGEYVLPCTDDENSDKLIESWLTDRPIYGVGTQQSNWEPLYTTDDDFEELPDFWDSTLVAKHVPQDQCCDLNIGTEEEPKNIQISKHLSRQELRSWQQFFIKHYSTFAWSYKNLKGVPPEVCEHHINLEENAKPMRQRQRRLYPKYSLLVKEEIEKLLEIGFIYPVSYSEWVSPIVIVLKKNDKIRICKILES
jgi:hypothetical protein